MGVIVVFVSARLTDMSSCPTTSSCLHYTEYWGSWNIDCACIWLRRL